jgi:hypothetical protein
MLDVIPVALCDCALLGAAFHERLPNPFYAYDVHCNKVK